MNISQIDKTQWSTSFAGNMLLFTEEIVFDISGTISGGSETYVKYFNLPTVYPYYSDAIYWVTGDGTPTVRPWKTAPRRYYYTNEPGNPTPRSYASKTNGKTRVKLECSIGNVTNNTFTLSGNYKFHIKLFVFGSNIIY